MRSQKSFQNGYCPFQSLHPQNGGNCGIIARGSFLSYDGTPHCEPLKCDILSFFSYNGKLHCVILKLPQYKGEPLNLN